MMTDKGCRGDINITNNFNAPIGQHIDHVDTINFRMDGDGTFHFGMVEDTNVTAKAEEGRRKRDEERFHFVHPELADDEAWGIHDAVKRLVVYQRVPEICAYLRELKQKGKIMLPSVSAVMYKELVRLGMPTGEGYSEKHFSNSYTK